MLDISCFSFERAHALKEEGEGEERGRERREEIKERGMEREERTLKHILMFLPLAMILGLTPFPICTLLPLK